MLWLRTMVSAVAIPRVSARPAAADSDSSLRLATPRIRPQMWTLSAEVVIMLRKDKLF
jgi:hypothetical protein